SVSVDDICHRAGVQKGSFYHFFPSKSELAIAAFDFYWEENRRPQLERVFSAHIPPLERFERYCEQVYQNQLIRLKQTGKVCGCPFSSIGSEVSSRDEKIRQKSEELSNRIRAYLESAL